MRLIESFTAIRARVYSRICFTCHRRKLIPFWSSILCSIWPIWVHIHSDRHRWWRCNQYEWSWWPRWPSRCQDAFSAQVQYHPQGLPCHLESEKLQIEDIFKCFRSQISSQKFAYNSNGLHEASNCAFALVSGRLLVVLQSLHFVIRRTLLSHAFAGYLGFHSIFLFGAHCL